MCEQSSIMILRAWTLSASGYKQLLIVVLPSVTDPVKKNTVTDEAFAVSQRYLSIDGVPK